jgi:hypothetical protein
MATSRLIASRIGGPAARYAPLATTTSPGGTRTVTGVVALPNELELNANLEQTVLELREESRPSNTAAAQDPKVQEFFHFCDVVYDHDQFKYNLNCDKVYRFMFYVSFREQKARGQTKAQKAARAAGQYFDIEDYRQVMAGFNGDPGSLIHRPAPEKPIGKCTYTAYKAVFRKIYKVQIARKVLSLQWDHIWTMAFDELYNHVKERTPLMKKLTYQEKVDGEFAPYMIVEHYPDMEEIMWNDSNETGLRSVVKGLRHRYCFSHLTVAVLRCECLHRAEFSDYLGIHIPKQDYDVHKPFLMVNQVAVGKTTHGTKQYGRATRHRDVRLCCVGAFAFYTTMRFYCTEEFKNLSTEDWLDNKKWFDIKVLADSAVGVDRTKEMRNDSYGDHIRDMLGKLNLSCTKILHLGRNLGYRTLELLEAESEEIRVMGQWAANVRDTSYSSKLPMGPIRKLAGYSGKHKVYFNTRTDVQPCHDLLVSTPMGEWCYERYKDVLETVGPGKSMTAISVLRFFCELNCVFLQDCAAMLVLHPERRHHAMFTELACLNSELFKVSWLCYSTLLIQCALLSNSTRVHHQIITGIHREDACGTGHRRDST